ncbi:MAG: hypothetical protein H6625_07305 [Bdellovibrionaceae bacterium]|nr:hypothetical protein [Pseudobdellovibrionaceae bacterium]
MKKEEVKLQKKVLEEAKKSFSIYTVQLFELNKKTNRPPLNKKIQYNVNEEIEHIKNDENALSRKRLRPSLIDLFVFSGEFNSVIGLEGLRSFKEGILSQIKDENKTTSLELNEEYIYQLIFASGIYIEYQNASEELTKLYDKYDYRNFQRWILLNKKSPTVENLKIYSENYKLLKYINEISESEIEHMTYTLKFMNKLIFEKLNSFLIKELEINIKSLYKAGIKVF